MSPEGPASRGNLFEIFTCKPWERQSQGPSCGWRMSGDLTSAMAGRGVKFIPRGLIVAGGSLHGVLDRRFRLNGLEGWGRTENTISSLYHTLFYYCL